MNKIILEITEQEASVLLQLLDGAVKFYGLNSAQAAAHFQAKLSAAKDPATASEIPLDTTV